MNYVAQSRSPRPAALMGAIGVPAAIAILLVTGLAVKGAIDSKEDRFIILDFEDDKPEIPPPPPKPDETDKVTPNPRNSVRQVTVTPENPFNMNDSQVGQTEQLPDAGNEVLFPEGPINSSGLGEGLGSAPLPPPPALLDPIPAKPKTSPGSWIGTSDYRSNWVRREMTGTARFSLEINTSGRVTSCTITGSTGHSALDTATCRLLQKRARFEPARDSAGDRVPDTYRSAITWRLPE